MSISGSFGCLFGLNTVACMCLSLRINLGCNTFMWLRDVSVVCVRGWGRERGPPYLVCWDKILLPDLKNIYSFFVYMVDC